MDSMYDHHDKSLEEMSLEEAKSSFLMHLHNYEHWKHVRLAARAPISALAADETDALYADVAEMLASLQATQDRVDELEDAAS